GDPLGPILFSLTIHPLLVSLSSELVFGYLDDVSIGGKEDTVERDVTKVFEAGVDLGLHINAIKCELITGDVLSVPSAPILQSFTRTLISDVVLLGSPLFKG